LGLYLKEIGEGGIRTHIDEKIWGNCLGELESRSGCHLLRDAYDAHRKMARGEKGGYPNWKD